MLIGKKVISNQKSIMNCSHPVLSLEASLKEKQKRNQFTNLPKNQPYLTLNVKT